MLTITIVVIMSNCRPASGNNSQNLATTFLIVHSVQSEKRMLCVEIKFVCELESKHKPMAAIFNSTLEASTKSCWANLF